MRYINPEKHDEIGTQIRNLEKIIKRAKKDEVWDKELKNYAVKNIAELQKKWKSKTELQEVFKTESKRIRSKKI